MHAGQLLVTTYGVWLGITFVLTWTTLRSSWTTYEIDQDKRVDSSGNERGKPSAKEGGGTGPKGRRRGERGEDRRTREKQDRQVFTVGICTP